MYVPYLPQLSEKNKYYHIAPLLEGLGKLPLLMRERTHSAVFNFALWFPHSTFQHSPYSLTVLQPIPKSEWCHSSLHIWWYFITPHLCYCLPLSNFPFFQSFWVLSFSTLHFKWCPFRKDSLIFLGVVCVLLQNIVHITIKIFTKLTWNFLFHPIDLLKAGTTFHAFSFFRDTRVSDLIAA